MSDFIQLHMLVSYPPSNLNRDDLGRPKTAVMGGTQRLRISSQSLKRAWRTSDIFAQGLEGHIGIRTKEMGSKVKEALMSGLPLTQLLEGKNPDLKSATIIPENDAKLWALQIASVFVDKPLKSEGKKTEDSSTDDTEGKKKGTKKEDTKSNINKDTLKGEQLVFYSNNEISAIQSLITTLSKEKRVPKSQELSSLLKEDVSSVDVAMFGRMLANATKYNVEASVQVAHAVTVHEVAVEDDYFTAVDDLNKGDDDAGAAHLGETEFASGLFYTYVCIDKTLLQKNLGGDAVLAKTAIKAFVEAATKVAPTGKQNSFASRAYASYLLAEKGTQQPRSLSVAYLGAVRDSKDLLGAAITSLNDTRKKMDTVYGKCCEEHEVMDAHARRGFAEQNSGILLPITMKEYLIFRIYGMMASWGDIAVGEFRPSYDRPSKSAVMGMVAAALGIRRDEEERLRELATGYCMAVRIDAPGILMRDYHTAQVPSSGKGRKKIVFPTRKAELSVPKDELNTILSSRDYRCDAVYSVCLWSRTTSPPYPLIVLKQHLENPVFGLYLGRKSCPLALPLQPQVIPAESISGALSSAHFKDAPFIARLLSDSDVRIFWEGDTDAGFPSVHTVQRRDDPLSRKRWQFGNRTEHSAMIRKPAGV